VRGDVEDVFDFAELVGSAAVCSRHGLA
jgi:hypothetical protein